MGKNEFLAIVFLTKKFDYNSTPYNPTPPSLYPIILPTPSLLSLQLGKLGK